MIYRHFSAPERAFSQLSHELIRHPRLDSDAVRLLTWQLSLHPNAKEPLSRTAERARIGATAFTRAKRQLKSEGFVHERRVQGAGGLWVTQQLVSSVPLSSGEAAKILGAMPLRTSAEGVSSQVAPSHGHPAVGAPSARRADGLPRKHREEDTSNPPPEPEPEPTHEPEAQAEPEPEPEPGPANGPETETEAEAEAVEGSEPADDVPDEARVVVAAFPLLSPALRHIPPGMREELTELTAGWLAAGHSSADIHAHVRRGLPGADTPVHRPGGLLRYLLREVPAVPPAPPAPPAAPTPAPADGPRLSARLAGTRECEGDHVQPMLFRPLGDETRCAACAPTPSTDIQPALGPRAPSPSGRSGRRASTRPDAHPGA
ncbi:hypothetical protein OG393_11260 [Streptomyces sp. NBC_01216]|uniref:hypothetical protein n=1 Tax=Streptomyces sp. NBC_01216 TaxID=2903778 RepID=UPI002E15A5F7|nr:hypothetical protein OG393_11260 [Streptomyces sp. NBC_01216]